MGWQKRKYIRQFFYTCLGLGFLNNTEALEIGFNQAWLANRFGTQWTHGYQPKEVEYLFQLNAKAKSQILRMWLFEGHSSTALIWNSQGVAIGLNPVFEKNFRHFISVADKYDVKIYVTVLAATLEFQPHEGPYKNYWYNVLNNRYGYRQQFYDSIVKPLASLLNEPSISPHIYAIDLVNEIDAFVMKDFIENKWSGANEFICSTRQFMRSNLEPFTNGNTIPITASIGWPWIPLQHRGASQILLDPNPHPDCVDFWDIHLYNNRGLIANCAALKRQSKRYNKKLVLGEFGQLHFDQRFDDKLQTHITKNFLDNALDCGFSAALAWRLMDVRPGPNEQAKYSYYAHGQPRPALNEFPAFQERLLASRNQPNGGNSPASKSARPPLLHATTLSR